MVFLVRRMICLVLCLLVWAGLLLPVQAAYRCSAMEGSRMSAPCCPSELEAAPPQTAISHHCCDRLASPTLEPATPHRSEKLRPILKSPLLLTVLPLLSPRETQRSTDIVSHRQTAPPSATPTRTGTTVLQI